MDVIGESFAKNAIYRGLGFRAIHRGIRVANWSYTDHREEERTAAAIAAGGNAARLNAKLAERLRVIGHEREKIRREWGGVWARDLEAPTTGNLLARLRAGEQFKIMEGEYSFKEMMIYNEFSDEKILEAAEEVFRSLEIDGGIRAQGSLFARFNGRVHDSDPKIRLEAQLAIIQMCVHNQYRAERSQQFMDKIQWALKSTAKLERRRAIKILLQAMGAFYQQSAQEIKEVFGFLMKLLGALSGE